MMEKALKQELVNEVNKCTDIELLDLVYRLVAGANKGSASNSERKS